MNEQRTREFEALEQLAQYQPDDMTASRALDRARAALHPGATQNILFQRRWLMRISAAAAIVLVCILGWFVTIGPTPSVSAAQMLRDAIEKRARYDGWYAIDLKRAEWPDWRLLGTFHGSTGRRLILLNDDSGAPMFEYVDPQADILAKYSRDTKTLRVTALSLSTAVPLLPTTDQQLLEMSEMADCYTVELAADGGQVRIVLRKKSLPADADEQERRTYSYWPVLVTCELDPQTNLIRLISGQQGEHDDLVPWVRYRYGVDPLPAWEDLPLPEGAKIDDQRPSGQVKALLDRLDAIRRDGLGFNTAILVCRYGDPIRGDLSENGNLSLYAERGEKWLKFTWNQGQQIDGWPEPTLDAVLAHLATTAPQWGVVYDGSTCWERWEENRPWEKLDPEDRQRHGRLSYVIWPDITMPGREQPVITVHPDAKRANRLVLEATAMTHWGAPEGELRPMQKLTMLLLDDLGPLPLRKTIQRFNPDGSKGTQMRWDYSIGNLAMYRSPVRVPLRWRRVVENESDDDPTWPQFYHLLPQPGVMLDAKWFQDPRKSLPPD